MSYAIMRGPPTAAQLYLDGIIQQLVLETKRPEDRYCLAKILFKCLRDNPQDVRQIDGNSGARATNAEVLEGSVRAALALQAAGLKPGDVALVISRNTLEMTSLYFGCLLAGVVLYVLHVGTNAYEMKHFLKIAEPSIIFTEIETLVDVKKALQETDVNANIILFGEHSSPHQRFSVFITGFDDQVRGFWPVDTKRDDTVIIFSTSGSTGLPKAAVLNNQGLVAQIPSLWSYHERFPKPTETYFCSTNPSWITHTIAMTGCATYGVILLTTNATINEEHLLQLFVKYKPTFTFLPAHLVTLINDPALQHDVMSCFDSVTMAGSVIPEHIIDQVQLKLRSDARAFLSYGMTEMQGFVTVSRPGAPKLTIGTVVNTMLFKIVDEKGNTLAANQHGELCLKSDYCVFKEYLNNVKDFEDLFDEEGWLKTGDKVYMDENENIFYVERIKFLIKYQNHHVSPSEVEEVIMKVKGVQSAVVCGVTEGPAALVVPRSGFSLTSQDIHDAVKLTLSDVKQLRGGVAFVESIPLLGNGKVNRTEVKAMFEKINKKFICYS